MKKLLTIAVCEKIQNRQIAPPDDGTEILYAENQDNQKNVYELIKEAKGKYICLTDVDFNFSDCEDLLKELDKATADIIMFEGGNLFKSATLKNLNQKNSVNKFSAEIFGAFNAKTITAYKTKPFNFASKRFEYSEEFEKNLFDILDEFKKSKAKLGKDIYTFISDTLLTKLVIFYKCAMVAIRDKKINAETLINFDIKLKDNIVLYLALEKRFSAANLKKLREKNFKINFILYNNFRKTVR